MVIGSFTAVAVASLLACAITAVGIYVIGRCGEWGKEHSVLFMSFAAGVLISVSFIHMIPRSLEMNRSAPAFLLVGFLAIYLSNRLLNLYVCHGYEATDCPVGISAVLGIAYHSLIDGVIYSVTFNVGMLTGVLAAIGMILHEFPEGVVTYLLLQRGGLSRRKSAIWAFVAAALSTPLGALLSYPFIRNITRSSLGVLLATSAGALIYVGASHLLPAVERENRKYSMLSLAAGVLIAAIIIMSES